MLVLSDFSYIKVFAMFLGSTCLSYCFPEVTALIDKNNIKDRKTIFRGFLSAISLVYLYIWSTMSDVHGGVLMSLILSVYSIHCSQHILLQAAEYTMFSYL